MFKKSLYIFLWLCVLSTPVHPSELPAATLEGAVHVQQTA